MTKSPRANRLNRPLVGIAATPARVPMPPGPLPAQVVLQSRLTARADHDGTVEAIEANDGWPFLAVQWHPEIDDAPASKTLFGWLIRQASS